MPLINLIITPLIRLISRLLINLISDVIYGNNKGLYAEKIIPQTRTYSSSSYGQTEVRYIIRGKYLLQAYSTLYRFNSAIRESTFFTPNFLQNFDISCFTADSLIQKQFAKSLYFLFPFL